MSTATVAKRQVLTQRRDARLQTPTDLTPAATKEVSAAMNAILADVFALYLKTKNFHWHMSGPHFRDYHLLLDEPAPGGGGRSGGAGPLGGGPHPQGHSKKALGGEEDGIETVLGQGLANGRERSRQRPRQAQDRVAQRRQRLRGAAGAHAAGVLAQAHVPAPVQLVLNRPVPAHKRQQGFRAGLLAGEARDGIRYLAAGLAPDLPVPLDAAHLGHARPIEMGHNLAARGDAARLEAPCPFSTVQACSRSGGGPSQRASQGACSPRALISSGGKGVAKCVVDVGQELRLDRLHSEQVAPLAVASPSCAICTLPITAPRAPAKAATTPTPSLP